MRLFHPVQNAVDLVLAELRGLRSSIQQLVGAVHDAEEAQNQERQQQPPVVRAELQIPETVERERREYQKKQHRVQVWLTVGTWLAFIAAAVYADIARRTYHEIKIQTGSVRDAADAAKSAANTSKIALENSEKAFKLEQRPYLVPKESGAVGFTETAVAGVARASITLVNVGHTPAQSASIFARMSRVSLYPAVRTSTRAYNNQVTKNLGQIDSIFKDIETKAANDKTPHPRQDVAPGTSFFFSHELASPLSDAEVKELTSGSAIILVYLGFVRYTDPFGQKLETEFCWLWFGTDPKIWHICPVHNVIK